MPFPPQGIEVHASDKHVFSIWFPQSYAPRIGDWICPPEYISSYASAALANNFLRATLILLQRKMTFDRIGAYVHAAGGAGAAARLGIYNVNPATYYPTSLIIDAGLIDCTAPGHQELTINQTLNLGWYALVKISNDATIQWRYRYYAPGPLGGADSAILMYSAWSVAQAYGALPANYPAGGTRSSYRIPSLRVLALI